MFSYTRVKRSSVLGSRHRRSSETRTPHMQRPRGKTDRSTHANMGSVLGRSLQCHKVGEGCNYGGGPANRWCCTSPALSLTLFPEIGGQFNIRRAEVLRGRELCGIRMLPNFQTVETTDIRVQRQQFMPRPNIVQDGGMAWWAVYLWRTDNVLLRLWLWRVTDVHVRLTCVSKNNIQLSTSFRQSSTRWRVLTHRGNDYSTASDPIESAQCCDVRSFRAVVLLRNAL